MRVRNPKLWAGYITGIIWGVVALLISMTCSSNIFSNNPAGTDSSVFQYMGMLIENGGVPYRDAFDHKGPLLYLINYLGYYISQRWGIWLLEVLAWWISLVFSYKTVVRLVKRGQAVFVVLLSYALMGRYLQGGNLVEEWAIPFISVATYVFVTYIQEGRVKKWMIFVCGGCCGAVLLLRPNMIAIWMVFCVLILMEQLIAKEYKELGAYVLYFVLGILVVSAPFCIYLLGNYAWQDFMDQYLFFNFEYQAAGWKDKIKTILFFLWNPLMFVSGAFSFGVALERIVHQKGAFFKPNRELFSSLLCYAVTILLLGMSGKQVGHYALVIIPVICITLGSALNILAAYKEEISWMKAGVFVILFLCYMFELRACYRSVESINESETQRQEYEAVRDIIVNNSEKDDTITIVGNCDYYYLLSNRMSSSKYTYQMPISETRTEIIEEYISDLQNENPSVIYITEWAKDNLELSGAMYRFIEEYGYQQYSGQYENVYIKE